MNREILNPTQGPLNPVLEREKISPSDKIAREEIETGRILGEGGDGRVFTIKKIKGQVPGIPLCVKIFIQRKNTEEVIKLSFLGLRRGHRILPRNVPIVGNLVEDKGKLIGYTMEMIRGRNLLFHPDQEDKFSRQIDKLASVLKENGVHPDIFSGNIILAGFLIRAPVFLDVMLDPDLADEPL